MSSSDGSHVFSTNSSCRNAFDDNVKESRISKVLKRRLPLLTYKDNGSIVLTAVNFGPGTTGTHAVHDSIGLISNTRQICHYCEEYAEVLRLIHYCIGLQKTYVTTSSISKHKAKCKSSFVLFNLSTATNILIRKASFISDTPVAMLYPDLVARIPKLLAISTYRDTPSYISSRLRHHNDDIICHPSLWGHSEVLHPFDIVACLRLKEYAYESLQYINP